MSFDPTNGDAVYEKVSMTFSVAVPAIWTLRTMLRRTKGHEVLHPAQPTGLVVWDSCACPRDSSKLEVSNSRVLILEQTHSHSTLTLNS